MANLITITRFIMAVFIVFSPMFSPAFWVLYILCGLSDILDGYIARYQGTCSDFGAILDSMADIAFILAVFVRLLPELILSNLLIIWIIAIACIRLFSYFIGYLKYHSFTSLHTYANKITGGLLFLFPVIYLWLGNNWACYLLCSIATISAVDELLITVISNSLDINCKGFFRL